MSLHPARILSVSIERDWREVYGFVSIPQNFPRWAAGLGKRFEQRGNEWIAEDPSGQPIRIRFSESNDYGVLDHTVVDVNGGETHNALRVVPNGSGAEMMFTLLRKPHMSEDEYAADAAAIARDLETLRSLLGRSPPASEGVL